MSKLILRTVQRSKGLFKHMMVQGSVLHMQVLKATFNAMKASSMARRLTTKSARRKSAW